MLFIGMITSPICIIAQNCDAPTGLNVTNISNFSATLNWTLDNNVDRYRVRYKEIGSSSWLFEHNIYDDLKDISNLVSNSEYIWQVKAFCSPSSSPSSTWSVVDTFITTGFPVDCDSIVNGTAFLDSCGNCVGGTTGNIECIAFTPAVSISLSTTECGDTVDITFLTSQDPNEPDILSSVFTSDGGSFDFSSLNLNDVIGSSTIIAGGGSINVNTTLMVDAIISSVKISVKAIDDNTGYGVMGIIGLFPGGDEGTSEISNYHQPIFKITTDYGQTWQGPDASDECSFYHMPNSYWQEIIDSWDDVYIDECGGYEYFIVDFWSYYDFDYKVDSAGNLHILMTMVPSDDYYVFWIDGAGWYHFSANLEDLASNGQDAAWSWSQVADMQNTWVFSDNDGETNIWQSMASLSFAQDNPDVVWVVLNQMNEFACGELADDAGTPDDPCDDLYDYTNASQDLFVYKSTDGGTNWLFIGDTIFNSLSHAIKDIKLSPSNNHKIFIASDKGLYYSLNGGLNFMQIMDGNF